MRVFNNAILIAVLALSMQTASSQPSLNDMTPAGFVREIGGVVQKLEQSASSLMSQGNSELAQQQLLMAALLKQLVEHFGIVYIDSMDKTFKQLNVTETNVFRDLQALAKKVESAQANLTKDVQETIYQAQEKANQIINRFPGSNPTPVFYGLSARDLMTDRNATAVDIEILGFLMSDVRLAYKHPVVRVNGVSLPSASVGVQNDRVKVTLPPSVAGVVGFDADACSPRKPFPVSIDVYYASPTPWYVAWRKFDERKVTFNGNVLPGLQVFELLLKTRQTRTVKTPKVESFSATSASVNVGCEQGLPGTATTIIPAGAVVNSCQSQWINTNKLSSVEAGACTPTPDGRTATGTIRGLNKDWFGNCPGGGQGNLRIFGEYTVQSISTVTEDTLSSQKIALRGRVLNHTLPAQDGVALNSIDVAVFRASCASVYDQITIQAPSTAAAEVEATSAKGYFKAKLRAQQFDIEARQ